MLKKIYKFKKLNFEGIEYKGGSERSSPKFKGGSFLEEYPFTLRFNF